MAPDQTATLGSASPPARGTQRGAPRALTGAQHAAGGGPLGGGGSNPTPSGTFQASAATGATARQIDYWARVGLLGDTQRDLGSGRRRTFTDGDLDVLAALTRLSSIGCRAEWLAAGVDAVRAARVESGEWLLVTIAGHALRCTPRDLPRIVHDATAPHAVWLVPLQAFDQGRPL